MLNQRSMSHTELDSLGIRLLRTRVQVQVDAASITILNQPSMSHTELDSLGIRLLRTRVFVSVLITSRRKYGYEHGVVATKEEVVYRARSTRLCPTPPSRFRISILARFSAVWDGNSSNVRIFLYLSICTWCSQPVKVNCPCTCTGSAYCASTQPQHQGIALHRTIVVDQYCCTGISRTFCVDLMTGAKHE